MSFACKQKNPGQTPGFSVIDAMRYIALCLLLLISVPASAECPALLPLPVMSVEDHLLQESWEHVAAPYSVRDAAGGLDYAPLGVGHLRIISSGNDYYDWQAKILLPVWRRPGGALHAWIYAGHVHPVDGSPPYPLTGAGMVETDYEQQTFVVYNRSADGWLQLRLASGSDGKVWTHECHLGLGKTGLAYQAWKALIVEHGDWLHFRARVPHALRAGPDTGSQRIAWIGLDHEFSLLEISGDWMRVPVRQPAWTCRGPEHEFQGSEQQGWVKWTDESTGPWVFYYTRGC